MDATEKRDERRAAMDAAAAIVERIIDPMLALCAEGDGVPPEDYDALEERIAEEIIRHAHSHGEPTR